jgi:membrane protein DedA with SNARE-associated domain
VVIILSLLADVSADFIYYAVGYFSRGAALKLFSKRLTPERLQKLDRLVHAHGSKAIAVLKYTPFLPLPGFIILGAAHMNFWRFSLVCLLSTLPRTALFVVIGYYAGYFFNHYSNYLAHSDLILFLCALIILGFVMLYSKITASIAKRFIDSA